MPSGTGWPACAIAIRIGVLGDESGPFRDISGYGARAAVEFAVEDLGGHVGGRPIEILHADHQNKPDVGTAIIRRWFDQDGVDVITDLSISSVALAAQSIARERKKMLIISGGASSDVTGPACTPYGTQWSDDTFALAILGHEHQAPVDAVGDGQTADGVSAQQDTAARRRLGPDKALEELRAAGAE